MSTNLMAKPSPAAESADEETSGGKRRVYALLGVFAAAALGAGGWFLLWADSAVQAGPVVAPRGGPAASVTPTPSATPTADSSPALDGPGGVDPFEPLVLPAAPTPAASTGSTPTSTPTSTSTASPAPSTTPTTAPSAAATVAVFSGVTVAADNASAKLSKDGKSRTVRVGDDLGSRFAVVALTDGRCVTLRHATARFDVCEGQTVRHDLD